MALKGRRWRLKKMQFIWVEISFKIRMTSFIVNGTRLFLCRCDYISTMYTIKKYTILRIFEIFYFKLWIIQSFFQSFSRRVLKIEVCVLTPNLKDVSKFVSPIKMWSFNLTANADADASTRRMNTFTVVSPIWKPFFLKGLFLRNNQIEVLN